MRTHSMLGPGRARRALVVLVGLVLAVLTMIALSPTSATAASTAIESRSATNVVAPAAWNPRVVPLYSGETKVALDSAEARKRLLDLCQTEDLNGYACITVGDGDGTHSGFVMYRCGWRKVYDFINAGALVNNQYGGARVRLYNASQAEIASFGNGRFGITDEILYATEWISIC
ncbi:hypothetical protein [Streptomyces sp. S.PB5]|uniref:hypothetical protein n=1 Tax=Streptomyces sp. S.PB5 TaxID=3020844 RepID=UPI0025AFBF05|nr:hypothetical protein [Streptomyces sp. S.PB5]MDN3027032.1 hypothetical protein [Streptomyces sp. S.PB5]